MWVPTHKEVGDYRALGLRPLLYAGNMWADWFARQGAMEHQVSQVCQDFYTVELEYHKRVAAYIGWAIRRSLKVPKRKPAVCFEPQKEPAKVPAAAVVRPQLVRLHGGGHVLCRAAVPPSSSAARPGPNSSCRPASPRSWRK